MNSFLALAQAVLATVVFGQSVTTLSLKKSIQSTVEAHKPEIECINTLYAHVQKLSITRALLSQLRSSMTFSADQWSSLVEDLGNRKEFFDELKVKMDKINLPNQANKWSDYTAAVFQGVGAVALGNLWMKDTNVVEAVMKWIGRNRVHPMPNKSTVPSDSFSNISQISESQIDISLTELSTHPSQIESTLSQLQSPEQLADTAAKPLINSVLWDRITLGINFVIVVGLLIGFVAGVVDIVDLVKEKKKLDRDFGEGGDFGRIQVGVIEVMKFVAIDLYQISNTSQYVLNDLSRIFLTKGVLTPKNFDLLYSNAVELAPLKFGVTDDYVRASEKFMMAVVKKGSSNQSNPTKLYGIRDLYDSFLQNEKPDKIMYKIAEVVSDTLGKYSLIAADMDDYYQNDYRFLHKVCNIMAERNALILVQPNQEGRKKIDMQYMAQIVAKFNFIYKDQEISLASLNGKSKKMLYHSIGLFSDNFYYDDATGKTLFGLKFSDIVGLSTYGDIFKEYEQKPPKLVKIRYSDEALEIQAQNNYIAQVKKLSGDESAVHPLFRYIRYLEVENPNEKDEKKKKYIRSIEGMKYTRGADTENIKSIERDFEKQNYYLVQ